MRAPKKVRVAVLYGGKSGEHEVSLQSAASVLRNLDPSRYEVIPVAIDKEGRWHQDAVPVSLRNEPESDGAALVPVGESGRSQPIDVVFPVLHGTFGEDGTIQGLLELADTAYVGCGVLASAIGMDKDVSKRLAVAAGIPVTPYMAVKWGSWERDSTAWIKKIVTDLGLPAFVKPANSGSSVGIHKVKSEGDIFAAIVDAFRYDSKILVEKAILARELEVSILENPDPSGAPLASVVGEIVPHHEFYSYEAKYLDANGAALLIPAKLSPNQAETIQSFARLVFSALECEGMARVDFFMDRDSGAVFLNELNTIPGFTSISMYPKLWEASGVSYSELLSRLIDLALARSQRKKRLIRDFHAALDLDEKKTARNASTTGWENP